MLSCPAPPKLVNFILGLAARAGPRPAKQETSKWASFCFCFSAPSLFRCLVCHPPPLSSLTISLLLSMLVSPFLFVRFHFNSMYCSLSRFSLSFLLPLFLPFSLCLFLPVSLFPSLSLSLSRSLSLSPSRSHSSLSLPPSRSSPPPPRARARAHPHQEHQWGWFGSLKNILSTRFAFEKPSEYAVNTCFGAWEAFWDPGKGAS